MCTRPLPVRKARWNQNLYRKCFNEISIEMKTKCLKWRAPFFPAMVRPHSGGPSPHLCDLQRRLFWLALHRDEGHCPWDGHGKRNRIRQKQGGRFLLQTGSSHGRFLLGQEGLVPPRRVTKPQGCGESKTKVQILLAKSTLYASFDYFSRLCTIHIYRTT